METDDQEVEELKRWWNENGKTVVAGLVLGLGGVFGWTTWQGYSQTRAEQASALYSELVNTAMETKHDQATRQTQRIVEEYPSSGYAVLASLVGARSALISGDAALARRHLEWARDNAKRVEWRDIARVRLARVLVGEAAYDEAQRELTAIESTEFAPFSEEISGDVAVFTGKTADARRAYGAALANEALPAPARTRIQMKLDDLGHLNVE